MNNEQIKDIIRKELPSIIKDDVELQELVLSLAKERFADRGQMESRFDRLLDELRRQREADTELWRENSRRWKESTELWKENAERWDRLAKERAEERRQDQERWKESTERWKENAERWKENAERWDRLAKERAEERRQDQERWKQLTEDRDRRWTEDAERWKQQRAEDRQRWAHYQKALENLVDAFNKKYESTLGALGARWGLHSEGSFRNALKGILEEFFSVQVLNVVELDHEGEVFGRPDQIELDLITKDGLLIICEIKSSMSKGDMHLFERKARFYERRHNITASRLIVISPMVDPRAKALAESLDISVYSYAQDVDPAVFL